MGPHQHRQRIAAGNDKIPNACVAQGRLEVAGAACQIDMLRAGGLKRFCCGSAAWPA